MATTTDRIESPHKKVDDSLEPLIKKTKIASCQEDESNGEQAAPKEEEFSLDGFSVDRVLLNDPMSKRVHVLGKFKDDTEPCVMTLSKTPFAADKLAGLLTKDTAMEKEFQNDIYSQHTALPDPRLNGIKAVVIRPATEKHIEKYSDQKAYLLQETATDFESITRPHMEQQQFSTQWVHNILDHKKEVDRIIYEDPDKQTGFILLPDLKWDGKQLEDLYVVAIVHARDLGSIRDLNSSHLGLLKNIRSKGYKAIKSKYGVLSSQLRVYFHYHPSYFHLHVHFTHVQGQQGGGCAVAKAHLLNDVIENIESVDSDYYKQRALTIVLREKDGLLKKFVDAKRVEIDI